MSLSVVIPHMPYSQEIEEKLSACVASLSGYNELILVVNDGIGYARAVNKGLRLAKGDHILVCNNDLVIEGDIRELCSPDAVTSPLVNNTPQDFHGCCYCLPRWVYERVGELDEQFEVGYFEDDDYRKRLEQAGISTRLVRTVKVTHAGGSTIKTFGEQKVFEANKKRFNDKWKSR